MNVKDKQKIRKEINESFDEHKKKMARKECFVCKSIVHFGEYCKVCEKAAMDEILKDTDWETDQPLSQIQDEDEFNRFVQGYWRDQNQW